MRILWIITGLSCLVGGVILLGAFSADSAPQQAAAAAMASAFAIIPYVFSRAVEKNSSNEKSSPKQGKPLM